MTNENQMVHVQKTVAAKETPVRDAAKNLFGAMGTFGRVAGKAAIKQAAVVGDGAKKATVIGINFTGEKLVQLAGNIDEFDGVKLPKLNLSKITVPRMAPVDRFSSFIGEKTDEMMAMAELVGGMVTDRSFEPAPFDPSNYTHEEFRNALVYTAVFIGQYAEALLVDLDRCKEFGNKIYKNKDLRFVLICASNNGSVRLGDRDYTGHELITALLMRYMSDNQVVL